MAFKGGKGKRAPYETIMLRIPLPIKPLVQEIASQYRHRAEMSALGEEIAEKISESRSSLLKEKMEQIAMQFPETFFDRLEVTQLKAQMKQLELEKAELLKRLLKLSVGTAARTGEG